MKLEKEQYEQILSLIPNTGLIVFGRNLEIIKVINGNQILNQVFTGIEEYGRLEAAADPKHRDLILEMSRNALDGKTDQHQVMGSCGMNEIHSFPISDSQNLPLGILMVRGRIGLTSKYQNELEQSRQEAEESSEIKSRFMARISHEIRTPLNAIIGFIEQLHKTELDSKQESYLKIIDKSSVYLLDLVNEILTFSKIESGEQKLDIVDFKLESLFSEIYQTFRNRAAEKKINLKYSFDRDLKLILRGDTVRIKQVVINLVSNAIKFTEYGYVELSVKKLKMEQNQVWIRIKVTDTGPGIAPDKIQDIFREYKQASAGIARKHGGTGLGLTISKRLAELMDGTIYAKSEEGKGSVFTIDLPLEKSKHAFLTKDTLQISNEVLSGKSALIVDDDAMNRMLGEVILEGFNMEVFLAADGQEAIELLRHHNYDIILLDIHMPVVSGLEVAKYIRNDKKDRKVKIIAVTADMIREELDSYMESGIDDYLIKPYREINMFNKLCQVLEINTIRLQQDTVKIELKEDKGYQDYDLSELRNVTRGQDQFFNEMIKTFIGNSEEGLRQFREEFARENWQGIREIAHRLIPSYKHLSINSVVSNLIELKNRCREQPDRIHLAALISRIEKESKDVISQLKQEIIEKS